MAYFPSASVAVPWVVPSRTTFAPISGDLLVVSNTLPVIVPCWAQRIEEIKMHHAKYFLMILSL
jgi:hypothetical protein